MQIVSKYHINDSSQFTFYYNGIFVETLDGVSFLYKSTYTSVDQLDFHEGLVGVSRKRYDNLEEFSYTSQWFAFHKDSTPCVCLGVPNWYICPSTHSVIEDDSYSFKDTFEKNYNSDYHYSVDSFLFNDLEVSHKGSFGYQCKEMSTGKLLWERKVKGYLYTDIVECCGGLLFGTAEWGGKLYYINLKTGESIFEIDTKGTQNFALKSGFCYCYGIGKKTTLLKIRIQDGKVEHLVLPGQSNIDCPIAIIGHTLYALTFERLDQGIVNPTLWAITDEDLT